MDFTALPKDYVVTSNQFTRTVHTTVYPAVDPLAPTNSLAGKTVVITGASRGIGARGIVPAFVKAGIKGLVLIATKAASLKQVEAEAKSLDPGVEILCLGLDISSTEHVVKVRSAPMT